MTAADATRTSSIGLFPGQGSQFVGMGAGLAGRFAEAAAVFDEASDAIDTDLRALCWQSSATELAATENAQLAIVVCSVAAWRVWAAGRHGTEPAAVAGHSVGALPAAMASGHLTLRDGIRLVRTRAQLMGGVPRTGSMLAVSVTSDTMLQDVLANADRLSLDVAARNGARQVVLSGSIGGIEAAKAYFGARSRTLDVSNGFHSRVMDPVVDAWSRAVADTAFADGDGPAYVASTTGRMASSTADVTRDLITGLRRTVRWDLVIGDATRNRWITFGPGGALARFGRGLIRADDITNVDDSFVADSSVDRRAHAR
ncbi:ACP S-malonyltransferase [Agreia sp. PsM10]|uniref:ACP S-malonyltransferase n=1 Tax=Agreia sp. PsM10 TaxID=3030533 RepID=UPI00263A6FB7|nr:ACP S-malonyltransferase [Agreia sp. PsM10]MDN4640410.1 ACP S-malonyltransferase [Agreia sp. PsM10]